eukprot:5386023-Heterocapsa_arctica.AAC.1
MSEDRRHAQGRELRRQRMMRHERLPQHWCSSPGGATPRTSSLCNDLFLISVEQLIYVYGKYDIIVEQWNANKFNGSNAYARAAMCGA